MSGPLAALGDPSEFLLPIQTRSARLIDPYSELLSRAAMSAAAASGDRTRLRREWDECRRRISELDPGATPSQETERLFDHLSRGARTMPISRQARLAGMDDAP